MPPNEIAKGGALDGGGGGGLMSNLRNGHVACSLAIHVPCHL